MVDMYDYKNEKGDIDWPKYREAQKAAGEICDTCECYIIAHNILLNDEAKGRTLCGECQSLIRDEELTHSSYVRCPRCGEYWNPGECEEYYVFEDGEHNVSCECGHDFEVSTSVSYSFKSPKMD